MKSRTSGPSLIPGDFLIMTYALLQTSLTPLHIDALQHAFLGSEALSVADAAFVGADAYGILARDLGAEEAQSIAAFLAAEDVIVELVAERDLPRLPDAEFFASAEFCEENVRFFDAREHPTDVPYRLLRLLAVGYDNSKREVRIELVFGDAVLRFRSTLEHLHFHHTPEVQGRSPGEKLVQWIVLLVGHAPHVLLNRGAANLAGGKDIEHVEDYIGYPRPSAFVEELIWMLWRARTTESGTPR